MTYNFGDIVNAHIVFTRAEGGKDRPLVYTTEKDGYIQGFELTGQKGNNYFRQFRYKIIDWRAAGCDKPSYINLYPSDTKIIPKQAILHYRGSLTTRDQQGLIEHLNWVRDQFRQ